MSKQNLLLVDGDTRSLRVLEVSLRKAGFSVTPAVSVGDALDKLEVNAPDLIISETKFATELDGFELRRRMRASPDWAEIPFIFLTAETAIENKIKGLELGVDDYLTKPIYIKEIVTRINILLTKRQRQFLDLKKDGTRFAGRVADMPVVDVIQTIEVSRKSGVIQFAGGPTRQAAIYFRDGKVIDAEAGTLQGEDAVYRLLTWNDGEFEVEFRTVRRREAITTSSQGLLMEGMRRLDEWSRLLEQLPPLNHRFEIDAAELSSRLGEIPDENNRILRLFDGKRTLLEVIDGSDFGDLECLQTISRLYFEGMLIDLDPNERAKRDTGKPMPLAMLEDAGQRHPTPIEEVASGPLDLTSLAARAVTQEIPVPVPMGQSGPVLAAIEAQPSGPVPVMQRMRRDSGEIVSDQEVLSEEDVAQNSEPGAENGADIRGPLMGGYRPSSLRLIDEAVAAAQLIEPSLFSEDELVAAGVKPKPADAAAPAADAPVPSRTATPPENKPLARVQLTTRAVEAPKNGSAVIVGRRPPTLPPPIPTRRPSEVAPVEAQPEPAPSVAEPPTVEPAPAATPPPTPPIQSEDYSGVPTVIEAELRGDSVGRGDAEIADEGPTDPTRRRPLRPPTQPVVAPPGDADAELKMIGSHGADRAEASGELKPVPPKGAESGETQRELVTIMPRRNTREIPTIDPKLLEAKDGAKPEAAAKDAEKPSEAKSTPAVEPPRSPPRRATPGSGVVKAPAGPGRGAVILMTVASVLVGATLFSYCHKSKPAPSSPIVMKTLDAGPTIVAIEPQDAEPITTFGVDASVAVMPAGKHDASVAVVENRPDAAVRADAATQVATIPHDAAQVAVVSTADAGIDKAKEAKALYEKGHAALEDGDPQTALDLLDQSLALKKQARTYLEKGRALQRMQKIDEALAAVDDAIKMNGSYAPAFEQKGMMLWSAQRYSDARPVLEHYLELDPNSTKADTIRSMLEENK